MFLRDLIKYCWDIIQRILLFLLWKINASSVLAKVLLFLSTPEVASVFTIFASLPGAFYLHAVFTPLATAIIFVSFVPKGIITKKMHWSQTWLVLRYWKPNTGLGNTVRMVFLRVVFEVFMYPAAYEFIVPTWQFAIWKKQMVATRQCTLGSVFLFIKVRIIFATL